MSNITLFSSAKVPAFARNNTLSDTARALVGSGGGSGGKRISIKGGVFRLMSDGAEVAAIEDRHLDIIIIKAAPKVGRNFYAAKFDKDAPGAPPDCWSNDGDKPDASISEGKRQSVTCMACPQNQAGSGNGNSRACRYVQRLAVVLENDPSGAVMQMALPATSIFGKEEGDKRPLQAYARYLAAQNPPVNPEQIVTRMRFDTKSESPKLFFQPMRWLDDAEYDIVKEQAETNDAKNAIVMVGNLTPSAAPMQIAGKPPAKLAAPAQSVGDMADEDEAEEDPPARVAKPAVKKAKPTPAPVVEEEDTAPEPEVRKTAAKPTAVPSGKSKLADIVSDWDDE
jgi:hypothetical protein